MDVSKELFDILFDGLKDAKSEYMKSVYAVVAANLAGLGWYLSSKDTREFLNKHLKVRFSIVGIIVFMAAFHWVNIFQMADRSMTMLNKIALNAFYKEHVEKIALDPYIVPVWWPYASCSFTGVLFVMLLALLITDPKTQS